MALEKKTEVGLVSVLPDGQLQVRTDTVILDDGVEISRTYHRHVVAPGDDLDAEDARVKEVATGNLHTAKVISDYEAAQAELEAAQG